MMPHGGNIETTVEEPSIGILRKNPPSETARGSQRKGGEDVSEQLHGDIIRHLPHLRALALRLARDRALADDLVQEAVMRALAHADQFRVGTNFKAWVMAILRNAFFSEMRRRAYACELGGEELAHAGAVSGGQEERLRMRDFERAFRTLPAVQREALVLVGARGLSYRDAARLAMSAVGTMKSRVSRARLQLGRLLDGTVPFMPAQPSFPAFAAASLCGAAPHRKYA